MRSDGRVLGALLGLALGLRLAHVASVVRFETSHVVPGLDRWLETEIARAVARGDWLCGPPAHHQSAPALALLQRPVYPLAGASWLLPPHGQAGAGGVLARLLYQLRPPPPPARRRPRA